MWMHRTKIGQTCLSDAANLGLKEMATLLCSHLKASTLHRDMKGCSAKEYAQNHSKAANLAACTKILQAHETKQRLAAQTAQKTPHVYMICVHAVSSVRNSSTIL